MVCIWRRTAAALLASASLLTLRLAAQSTVLEAEIPTKLTGDALAPGSSFALKVIEPWHDGPCSLIPGAMLHAVVERVERNGKGHTSSIAFAIQTACGDQEPLRLVVTSLLAPVDAEGVNQQFFRSSSFGEGTGLGKAGNTVENHVDMSGRQNPTLPFSNGDLPLENRPKAIHLGEVWHVPHVKLAVPVPGGTLSTLLSSGTTLTLAARTTFVLQGSRMESRPAPLSGAALRQSSITVPRVRLPFIKACVSEHCAKHAESLFSPSFGITALDAPQDLSTYGFRGERDRELKELDYGATLRYLAINQLLVAFPSHHLIKRTAGERRSGLHPRSIRAILLDSSNHSLLKSEDWEVEDSGPYLWTLGQRVLVHDGDMLRVYGAGLEELATFALGGPLANVRISPDGTHVLVGRIHELHSREDHDLLLQADARGPEEEVQWLLLDGDLKVQTAMGSSSTLKLPPVLLDSGFLELRKESSDRWHLVHRAWGGPTEQQLGSFESSCLPSLDTTSPDLLVLGTCDTRSLGAHTYFLREDGSPVLDEVSAWHDLPLAHTSATEAGRLALLVSRGKEAYTRGAAFRVSNLQRQTTEVVNAANGRPVASVTLAQPSPYKESVALSPDGGSMAVLNGTAVSFYGLTR